MNHAAESLSVSIALATYNGENYLQAQLESLGSQSELPLEILVTDDGSTDKTIEILREFSQQTTIPVRIFQNPERLGFANNFLKAASLCSGDLVAFCDQDDVWAQQKLQKCRQEFRDSEVLLCLHTSAIWDGRRETGRCWPQFPRRIVFASNSTDPLTVYPGFSMVIRKSLLGIISNTIRPTNIHSLGWDRHPMSHDQWVWFLASIFGKIACVPDKLALYRQHDRNVYGAGPSRNSMQKLRLSMNSVNYRQLADLSLEYVGFLESVTPQLSPSQIEKKTLAVEKLRRRALYQARRASIYDGSLGRIFSRMVSFLAISASGGYLPDRSKMRLGPRAALKDLLYGVPGLYKLRLNDGHELNRS